MHVGALGVIVPDFFFIYLKLIDYYFNIVHDEVNDLLMPKVKSTVL